MNIAKQFFKDSTLYSLQPILSKLITFLLIPIYTKYLTPADYGNLQYILTFGLFFRTFVGLGLETSFWKFRTGELKYDKGNVSQNVLLTQLFASSSVLLISLIIKFTFFINSVLATFIIIYFTAEVLYIFYYNGLLIHRANLKVVSYLIGTSVNLIALVGFNLFFVAYLKMNFNGVIFSYLLSFFISSIIFYKVFAKEFSGGANKKLVREMLRYGFPLMLGNIAAQIITLGDRVFLKEFVGDTQLGLYTYGYKFADILKAFLIQTFFLAWNPLRWQIYEMKNGKEIFSKFNKLLLVFLPMFSLIVLSAAIVVGNFMTVDKSYLEGFKIIIIIGFSHVLFAFYYFNSMGMLFKDKSKLIMYIVLGSSLISLTLNYFLIPIFGLYGAATSAFASNFSMFLLSRYFSQKFYPIERQNSFEFLQIVIIVLLVIFLSILGAEKIDHNVWAGVIFLTSIIYFLSNLVFKNISINELLTLKKKIFK